MQLSKSSIIPLNQTLGWTTGVTISYNLFEFGEKEKDIRNAKISLENSQLSLEKSEFNAGGVGITEAEWLIIKIGVGEKLFFCRHDHFLFILKRFLRKSSSVVPPRDRLGFGEKKSSRLNPFHLGSVFCKFCIRLENARTE